MKYVNRPCLHFALCLIVWGVSAGAWPPPLLAQDQSVRPGINDSFQNPNVTEFADRFEVESREVYALRGKIVAACDIKPGMVVADIGAGTGLFTRLFAEKVGSKGRVIAVDIAENFLKHIASSAREQGLKNVDTLLATPQSSKLPSASIDLAFICDTYHHFEFPQKTLASLRRAMKPGGRIVLIDFHRIPGKSSDWTLDHVRAGQDVFEAEIAAAGFRKVRQERELLEDNYFVVFEVADGGGDRQFPIIDGYGGVAPRSAAVEPPRAGVKVVFDVTAGAKSGDVNPGLERVARLLNLYGVAGLKATDVRMTVVLHGQATSAMLHDAAYEEKCGQAQNPNLPLVKKLQQAGVEVLVCGQALSNQGIADSQLAADIPIATAAMTVVINRQADGHATISVP